MTKNPTSEFDINILMDPVYILLFIIRFPWINKSILNAK